MGTKSKPGRFDCYEKAGADEPLFVLLARDESAPALLELWSEIRRMKDPTDPKIGEALRCASAMRVWRTGEP